MGLKDGELPLDKGPSAGQVLLAVLGALGRPGVRLLSKLLGRRHRPSQPQAVLPTRRVPGSSTAALLAAGAHGALLAAWRAHLDC